LSSAATVKVDAFLEVETVIPFTEDLTVPGSDDYISASNRVIDSIQGSVSNSGSQIGLSLSSISVSFAQSDGRRRRRTSDEAATALIDVAFSRSLSSSEIPSRYEIGKQLEVDIQPLLLRRTNEVVSANEDEIYFGSALVIRGIESDIVYDGTFLTPSPYGSSAAYYNFSFALILTIFIGFEISLY